MIDGHDFKNGSCAKCGIGRAAYDNHRPVCSSWDRAADEKLIIFGWITTILGLPAKLDSAKYNKLTDKLYEIMEFKK